MRAAEGALTLMGSIRSRLSLFMVGVVLLTVLAAGGILLAVRVSDGALSGPPGPAADLRMSIISGSPLPVCS